ncbi:hypothetical protein IPM09_02095 [Candidatus Saccharibacteria bacterium]|nr:MAG: hypothetical protein IPM09_02095 [Candidatus Saccharibacteria bacterium]
MSADILRFTDPALLPGKVPFTDNMKAAYDDLKGDKAYRSHPDLVARSLQRLGAATYGAIEAGRDAMAAERRAFGLENDNKESN